MSLAAALLLGSPLLINAPTARAAGPNAVFGGPLANPYVPFVRIVPPIGNVRDGDIDRPIISGKLYDGADPPKPPNPVFFGQAEGNLDTDTTFDAWSISTDSRTITPETVGQVASGEPANDQNDVNEPVNLATGNYYMEDTLPAIEGKGPALQLRLSYNSQDQQPRQTPLSLGPGWQANWTVQLLPSVTAGTVTVDTEEGRQDVYTPLGGGLFQPPSGQFAQLLQNPDGTFDLRRPDRSDLHFTPQGILQGLADRNGNALRFNYDISGRLVSVTDAAGRSDSRLYGPGPQPQSMSDPLGRLTQFSYDAMGHLNAVTDPAGQTSRYIYDASGRLVQFVDPRGGTRVTNAYDAQGRITQQTDVLGHVWTFVYGAGQTTLTDPGGCVRNSFFDVFYRVTLEQDCVTGAESAFSYNGTGRLASQTDQLGRTTSLNWDGAGNPLSWQDTAGDLATFSYDGLRDLLTATDPRGNTTRYTYDANGDPTSVTGPLGDVTRNFFDVFGELMLVQDPLGNSWTATYDASGNRTSTADPLGNTAHYGYDAAGRLTTATDPLGNVSAYQYDPVDRPVRVTDPLGHTDLYSYDANGNRVSSTDRNGHATLFAYDTLDRQVSTTDANGGVTTETYDPIGRPVQTTDANGHTTIYQYDALGRLTGTTDALGRSYAYTYDAGGARIGRTDGMLQQTQYGYDAARRLIRITYPTSSVTFAYDADGNRTQMTDPTGTTAYTYDAEGRLTQTVQPPGSTVAYQYDAVGNRIGLTYPDAKTLAYTYDAAGRLTQLRDWATRVTAYTYDAAGRPTNQANANGTSNAYTYDQDSRLTGITPTGVTPPGGNLAYTYDAADNVLSRMQGTLADSYSYDAGDRLLRVGYGEGDCQQYSYDAAGNRTSLAVYPPGPCVSRSGTTAYSYDAADQLQMAGPQPFFFDKDGNQVGKGNDVYIYDAEGRLTAIHGQPPNPSGQGSSCIDTDNNGIVNIIDLAEMAAAYNTVRGQPGFNFVFDADWSGKINIIDLAIEASRYRQPCQGFQGSYTYNGDGLRVSKTENGQTTSYVLDVAPALPAGTALWARHSEDTVALQDSLGNTFEQGLGNALILQDSAGSPSWYMLDAQGSTTGLANGAGADTASYRYDVYGGTRISAGSPAARFMWQGLESDASGNVNVGPSTYEPSTGRLTSVSGLESETEVVEYKDGEDGVMHTRPGNAKPGRIKITRDFPIDNPASPWTIRRLDELSKHQAGTAIHELGHTFGLDHGGPLYHYEVFGHGATCDDPSSSMPRETISLQFSRWKVQYVPQTDDSPQASACDWCRLSRIRR